MDHSCVTLGKSSAIRPETHTRALVGCLSCDLNLPVLLMTNIHFFTPRDVSPCKTPPQGGYGSALWPGASPDGRFL